jgi:hypothetical protein
MTSPASPGSAATLRVWTAAAAASAALLVALLTLAPRSFVAPARSFFERATDAALAALVERLPFADTEQLLNTLLYVPLGATLALLLGRRLWMLAIPFGFAVSAIVEVAQSRIPGRVPDLQDVLWNTSGATVGAVVVCVAFIGAGIARLAARALRRGAA